MDTHALAAGLAPIVSLVLFGGIALGIKWAIATFLPDSWLKRQLLKERMKSKYSASNQRVLEQAALHTRGMRK